MHAKANSKGSLPWETSAQQSPGQALQTNNSTQIQFKKINQFIVRAFMKQKRKHN